MPNFVDGAVKEIEDRIRALEDEASRLEAARAILVGGTSRRGRPGARSNAGRNGGSASQRTRRRAGSSNGAMSVSETAVSETRGRSRRSGARATSTTNGRSASGATKAAVLGALAGGEAMTASQVAGKAGLARPTVSTTLSKLAKSGEVQKAERGYRLGAAV